MLEQHRSNGLDYMGPIKPSLALCVFGVFVLVYFSLWKGVRSAGKVSENIHISFHTLIIKIRMAFSLKSILVELLNEFSFL